MYVTSSPGAILSSTSGSGFHIILDFQANAALDTTMRSTAVTSSRINFFFLLSAKDLQNVYGFSTNECSMYTLPYQTDVDLQGVYQHLPTPQLDKHGRW